MIVRSTIAAVIALLLLAPTQASADVRYSPQQAVVATWYLPTGNRMYNGEWPHIGAAACSWNIPLGSLVLFPDGRVTVCKDRGHLGNQGHIDIFVEDRAQGREVALAYPATIKVDLFKPE